MSNVDLSVLDQWLQVGNSVRLFFGDGNSSNTVLHIRAIVDGDQIVIRQWLKYKKRWHYRVEPRLFFEVHLRANNLQIHKL